MTKATAKAHRMTEDDQYMIYGFMEGMYILVTGDQFDDDVIGGRSSFP